MWYMHTLAHTKGSFTSISHSYVYATWELISNIYIYKAAVSHPISAYFFFSSSTFACEAKKRREVDENNTRKRFLLQAKKSHITRTLINDVFLCMITIRMPLRLDKTIFMALSHLVSCYSLTRMLLLSLNFLSCWLYLIFEVINMNCAHNYYVCVYTLASSVESNRQTFSLLEKRKFNWLAFKGEKNI